MIQTTEVDGVPTLLAPSSGPMAAGLMFRVGQADETMPLHGITHLVEHLALHDSGLSDYHYNGETSSVYTHFHLRGNEHDVVAYLGRVCSALADLPMHRLETEKQILRTESRTRGGTPNMPLWRYGARGYGLPSYPEWGLHRLRPEDLRWWVESYFTRENAVLWIAGRGVPAGLRLPLRPGARRLPPEPTSALPDTPAYFTGEDTSVVLSSVVRRSTAAGVFTGVLERELFRDLRQEDGNSYTASAVYEPRGDGFATIMAYADALPGKQNAVLGGFIDVLARLRYGNIDPQSVAGARTKALDGLDHPDAEAARLPGHALNLLTGQPLLSVDQLRDELWTVTPEQVHAVAVEAVDDALLQTPCHARADWAGFAAAPTSSAEAAAGRRYPSLEDAEVGIVFGHDAVSVVNPRSWATVRYQSCAAVLAWPDGGRQLIGEDGIVLRLEPTLWAVPPQELAALDAAIDPSRHIPLPAREPDAIPRPQAPQTPVGTARRWTGGEIALMVLLGLPTVGFALMVLLFAAYMLVTDEAIEALDWQILACSTVGTALFAAPMVLIARRHRRR